MSMTPRRVLFWLHLTAGVIAGIVVFFLSITGACIAYQRQAISWADRGHRIAAGNSPRQPLSVLMENAQHYAHAPATAVSIHSDASMPVEVTIGRELARVVLLDPYSGSVLGDSAPRLRAFFAEATALHRWFGMQGANRATARAIKGAFTLAMLFLVCSGVILWIPRKWTRSHVGKALLFRRNLQARARNWNWHNVIGIWLSVPLLLISLTGVIMAYPWANDLLYRITGNEPPPRQTEGAGRGPVAAPDKAFGEKHRSHNSNAAIRVEALIAAANQSVPGWQTITLRIGGPQAGGLVIQADRGDGGRPDLRTQITLDSATGRPIRVEPFSSYNAGRRLRMWARFTHTGEAGGLAGETIAAIAALGAAALMWTGFALALHRLRARLHRKPAHVGIVTGAAASSDRDPVYTSASLKE